MNRLTAWRFLPALVGAAALTVIGAAPPALAAGPHSVLYVSAKGHAAGPGTRSAPYQTIAEAVAAAPPGATIKVLPGTYTVSSPIDLSQSVTIQSAAGASRRVVITGQAPVFLLQDGSSGVTGVTIKGLVFRNITNASANGVITVPGYGAGDVRILDNTFVNTATQAIGYHGNAGLPAPLGTHFNIVGNRIDQVTGSLQSGIFVGNLMDSRIVDNVVEHTAWAGIIATAAGPGDTGRLVIARNFVSSVPHEGIQVAFGDHVLVRDNVVTHAGMDGYASPNVSMDAAVSLFNTDQSSITVTHNTLVNNYQGVELGQANFPPSLSAVGSNIVIRRNNLVNNPGGDVVNNATSGSLNATLNWWGTRHGPSPTDVVGTVLDSPYLRHPVGRGMFAQSNGRGPGRSHRRT